MSEAGKLYLLVFDLLANGFQIERAVGGVAITKTGLPPVWICSHTPPYVAAGD